MDLSVIIVNFNTEALLRQCLKSIFDQTDGLRYEVIVVDNASTDHSREMLESEFPSVMRVFNSQNIGFAAGNNIGMRQARGEYLLLLNSDTLVLDGAVQKTLGFMKSNSHAAVAGCKLLNADRSVQPSTANFLSPTSLLIETLFLHKLFGRSDLFEGYYKSLPCTDKPCEVEVVKGAFMLIRADVMRTLGGFDESYFMYTEETDLCYRARMTGHGVYFYPHAHVIHYEGGSVKEPVMHFQQVHRSQMLFILKHFRGLPLVFAVVLKVLQVAIRVPVYAIVGFFTLRPAWLRKSWIYFRVLATLLRRPRTRFSGVAESRR
ncbi:MAG: glycosyltransferase family 2 protein [Ignavibacteria bacterium]|nr:glycosyltransferase family 2 protein [Ignavibacteria bacterium]